MTVQTERAPKKIRIQHGTDAERSLALAEKINNTCGGALDDGVCLKDLYFWDVKYSPHSHPPDKWVGLVQDFTQLEKSLFFRVFGNIARRLKKGEDSASLGDLRSLSREKLWDIPGVNIITAELLIRAFRKPLRPTS